MFSNVVIVDPADSAIVTFDWSDVLGLTISLAGVVHTVPAPLTKGAESTDVLNQTSAVKVSGAVHGGMYLVEAQATLSNGETINRQATVRGFNA
jgi:hypothetical protein